MASDPCNYDELMSPILNIKDIVLCLDSVSMKSLLRGGAFMLLVLEMSFTMPPDRKTEDDSVVCKICR